MRHALEELEELLPELSSAVERRQIGVNLGKTINALEDSSRQVERLIAVIQIARETSFETDPNQAETLNELIETSRDTADAMVKAETPDQVLYIQEAYKEFTRLLTAMDRQVRPHWRRIVERDFVPLSAIGG